MRETESSLFTSNDIRPKNNIMQQSSLFFCLFLYVVVVVFLSY